METPARFVILNKICDYTVTSCTSMVIDVAKILSPKSLWNLCWRRLVHYPQVQTKHTCSELRNTLSKQATRFNSHIFCPNPVPSFHVCTVGENMPLKGLDSSIDHITTIQSFWRCGFQIGSLAFTIQVCDRTWTDNVDRL